MSAADDRALVSIEVFLSDAEGNIYPQPDKPESSYGKLLAAKEAVTILRTRFTPASDGYKQAWQEIADLLKIPAQAVSPREVHETQVMPVLRTALRDDARQPADGSVEEKNARLRSGVIGDVLAEVEKAVAKFPTWQTRIIDAGNVVSEEAGELAKACLQVTYEPHKETLEGVRMEAIQTAAMCLRFLASIDRYDCSPAEQHEQPVSALFALAALEPPTSTEGEGA